MEGVLLLPISLGLLLEGPVAAVAALNHAVVDLSQKLLRRVDRCAVSAQIREEGIEHVG